MQAVRAQHGNERILAACFAWGERMSSNWAVFAGVDSAGADGVRTGNGTGRLTGAAEPTLRRLASPSSATRRAGPGGKPAGPRIRLGLPRYGGRALPSGLAAPLTSFPAANKVLAKPPPIHRPRQRLSLYCRSIGGSVPAPKTSAGFGLRFMTSRAPRPRTEPGSELHYGET